jgi:hypothetical protein
MDTPVPAMPEAPLARAPGLWKGEVLQRSDEWIFRFPEESLAEIEAALGAIKKRNLAPPLFGKTDFPLPKFGRVLETMLQELEYGRGFFLMRGFPIERFEEKDAEIIFWGLGLHLGTAVSQNAHGHLIGHVRDLGMSVSNAKVRAYQTTAELFFHNDMCDVLLLLCRKRSKAGGVSKIVSVTQIQNEIQRRRPDLLEQLYRPYYIDRRGEAGRPNEGTLPYFAMPVLSYHQGRVFARTTLRSYIESAQRFPGVPPLSDKQIEALDMFETVAEEKGMALSFEMEPGDFQLLNNYYVLHARTTVVDFEEPERKRHLFRLWLSPANSRELPSCFESRFGTCQAGAVRGGVPPRESAARGDKTEQLH